MRFAAALAFVVTLLFATVEARACTCQRMSQAEAVKRADVVFQGRVLDVYRDGARIFATLTVTRVFKGNVRTQIEVGTNASPAACGYSFRRGQIVTVGAQFRERQYRTHLCLMLPLNRKR